MAGVFVFYVLPFLALGWSAAPLTRTNAEFTTSGGMSLMTVARVFHDPLILRGHWWLLGLAWVVALAVAALALRRGVGDADDLVSKSAALVLVFFLTRTWLSEPNAVLLLPLVLILTTRGRLDGRALTVVWVVPLLYAVANAAPLQTLWLLFPGAMQRSLDWIAELRPRDAAGARRAGPGLGDRRLVDRRRLPAAAAGASGRARGGGRMSAARDGRPWRGREGRPSGLAPHALPGVALPIVDDRLTLRIDDGAGGRQSGGAGSAEPGFPTSRLRTGLALWDGGSDLSEEGVGFGVPVLTMGTRAVFPGHVRLVVATTSRTDG